MATPATSTGDDSPPASVTPAAPSGSDGGDSSPTSQDLILKVLGFVGTGLGVLGFVTFFGGAILWIRAENAGLPANDAVSVVPRSVLVTTGASFLVPAVLLALFAVTLIILIHLGFGVARSINKRRKLAQARAAAREAEQFAVDANMKEWLADVARSRKTQGGDAAERAKEIAELEEEAFAVRREEGRERTSAMLLEQDAALFLAKAQYLVGIWAGGLIVFLVPMLFDSAIRYVGDLERAILVAVAFVAAAVSMGVYEATKKVLWFGVVAFVTVGVYLGFAAYFRTDGTPKMEPAAALRTDHPPVVGIYIADTASNLYLGTLPGSERPSHLMVIPRGQVTDLAIGPLLGEEAARQRALELVIEQCEQTISAPRTDTFPVPKRRGCSRHRQAEFVSLLDWRPG